MIIVSQIEKGLFMNNLVFNSVASQLKTTIYSIDQNSAVQPIKIDTNGTVYVTTDPGAPLDVTIGTLPAVTISGTPSVNINNDLTIGTLPAVTISGTPSVNINNNLTIGTLPAVTISGTPSVNITNDLTIGTLPAVTISGTPSVKIEGIASVAILNTVTNTVPIVTAPSFTLYSATLTAFTTTTTVFANTDTSKMRNATIFLYNTGANSLTAVLQYSPASGLTYINDTKYGVFTIAASGNTYLELPTYAQLTQVSCTSASGTNLVAYFNGQS